ncbi:MAG: DUF87 domain-containing protein [Verrucomicrobiota bacterium]
MKTELHLAPELALPIPIDAATQTFAFIARKGAGKTYAAGKLAEELLGAGVQVVVLDTVGNWYGLRIAADGKGDGFDIPVLGGLRGDIPLEISAGGLVADLVADTGRSVIIDISQFSISDYKRFATSFAEQLWQRKKAEHHPTPLHLVIEESQTIIPQFVGKDDARMVGIFERIVRLGRNYGIGVSMITQRPQSVNKEALTQTECLVVLQVNGTHERKAIGDWIVHQGMDEKLVDQLPSLPVGTAFVWSPQWLGIFQRVQIGRKRTLDTSATPKVGEKRVRRELKPLDLAQLQERMQEVTERHKQNDPAELKKQIRELERRLSAQDKELATLAQQVGFGIKADEIEKLTAQFTELQTKFGGLSESFGRILASIPQKGNSAMPQRVPARVLARVPSSRAPEAPPRAGVPPERDISGGLRRMLIALAQRPQGMSARQLGVRAGLSSYSGTFGNYLSKGRANGWIDGDREHLRITDAGLRALGEFTPLPTGRELLTYYLQEIRGGAARMLYALANRYPNGMAREELAQAAGLEPNSGTFGTYLGKLRTLELVQGSKELRASDELFD